MLCHLAALSAFVGVPFGHVLGPLVVWLIKRNEIPMVEQQGKESLNFQISMTIYGMVAFLLVFVVVGIFLLIGLGDFQPGHGHHCFRPGQRRPFVSLSTDHQIFEMRGYRP